MSDKIDRFKAVASKRVNAALKQIESIGDLASRRTYEYRENEAQVIIEALEDGIARLRARLFPIDMSFRF